MSRILIVGGGIVGTTCARLARARGHEVQVWDDARPENGSTASAGVMHPGWAPVTKQERQHALLLLESLYGMNGLRLVDFWDPKKQKRVACEVLSPVGILERDSPNVIPNRVHSIGNGWLLDGVTGATHGGYVYVATGSWAGELVYAARAQVTATMGTAILRDDYNIAQPYLSEWAPYKQLMILNHGARLWAGDGTAILPQNYTYTREMQSFNRVAEVLPQLNDGKVTLVRGRRPVIKGSKEGFCEEVMPKCWLATGGSKSSTLLSAVWAEKFLNTIKR